MRFGQSFGLKRCAKTTTTVYEGLTSKPSQPDKFLVCLTVVPLEGLDDRPEHGRGPAPVIVQGPVEQTAPQVGGKVPHERPCRRRPNRLYRRRRVGVECLHTAQKEGGKGVED